MTDQKKSDVKVSVVDQNELKKINEQKKKIERIIKIVKEEWLDTDEEFMEEVRETIVDSL